MSAEGVMGKANAIGGRSARTCDGCAKERARWYCAADKAYLCERCDGSVHTANAVARRHERVRLRPRYCDFDLATQNLSFMGTRKRPRTSRPHPHANYLYQSKKPKKLAKEEEEEEGLSSKIMTMAVPENSMAENEFKPLDDEDDELLPQVPIFHMPLAEEFCVHEHSRMMINSSKNIINSVLHQSASVDSDKNHDDHHPSDCCVNLVVPDGSCCDDLEYNFLGSDQTDLCEFGMDMEMESIIGQGLGLYCSPSSDRDFKQHDTLDSREIILDNNGDNAAPLSSWLWASRIVKVEEADHDYEEEEEEDRSDDHDQAKSDIAAAPKVKLEVVEEPDPSWDTIELNIDHYHDQPDEDHGDCNIQTTTGAQEATLIAAHDVKTELDFGSILGATSSTVDCSNYETKLSLRLNYEDVLSAWSDRGSFRASDSGPATVPDHHDCSSEGAGGSYDVGLVPDLSLSSGPFGGEQIGQVPMMNGGDQDSCRHGGGREARVLRYREKRRTRLFSKKIRYEVRKLNAEKRPRMKGRFVKRTSGMSSD